MLKGRILEKIMMAEAYSGMHDVIKATNWIKSSTSDVLRFNVGCDYRVPPFT